MNRSTDIVAEDGFERLLSSNEPRLKRIARSYGGADWQDLLQEIHLQLWRSRERFRGDSRASTWLYRVALNTAFSFTRGKRITTRPLDSAPEQGSAGQPLDPAAILGEFLGELNPARRAILLLYLEGLSHDQIAEVVATSPGAVATTLSRLKRKFEQSFVE